MARLDCLWPVGRWVECEGLLAEAAAIADRLKDGSLRARVLWWKACVAVDDHDDLDAARRLAEEAMQAAAGAGDEWQLAIAQALKAGVTPARAERRVLAQQATARLRAAGNLLDVAILLGVQAYWALLEGDYGEAQELLAQEEPIARLLDDTASLIAMRSAAGFAAVLTRDVDLARRSFRDALLLCRETVLLPRATQGLLGHAALAALDGDHARAARLSGAAAARRFGERPNAVELRVQEKLLTPAREALRTQAWEAAAVEGAALGFRDAIAYALEEQQWRQA